MTRLRVARFFTLPIAAILFAAVCYAAPAAAPNGGPALINDSLYAAHHPRLLFTRSEIPTLYAKVRNGGNDDNAYAFIRVAIEWIYPSITMDQLLDIDFGLAAIPNLGLGAALQSPPDEAARNLGRTMTRHIADSWDVDNDDYRSSLRLRALSLGYDMFYENGTPAERAYIRDEIRSYMDMMLSSPVYAIWRYQPYLSNRSAMIAAALGLAAICLDGETDSTVVRQALDAADSLIDIWLDRQVDSRGSYNEGALYGAWSLRNLAYYFHARLRYDGYDYAGNDKIRQMERWFVYELVPEGGAKVNNIQDCTYADLPLGRHTTYFDWAQTAWGSRLCAYVWEHIAGLYGLNLALKTDKAATVLWNQNLQPEQPDSVLPKSMLWEDRGLYYYRTGWPSAARSKDVLFSFYSGRFQGGHAQEDQNQFTLYGYGASFAVDHGPGNKARQSEAHNIVLIDGMGQHNAGNSIGTDGRIAEFLISEYADYVLGDATSAYTTYSDLNRPGFPFPTSDWSWGYHGANPVDFAHRKVVVVRDDLNPPYFLIVDDIEKDGSPHPYEWRLHTRAGNAIDMTANPIRITADDAFLDLHILSPEFASLGKEITPFDNLKADPDSDVLRLSTTAVNPAFALLLFPGESAIAPPSVTTVQMPWGVAASVVWNSGTSEIILINDWGARVSLAHEASAARHTRESNAPEGVRTLFAGTLVETDASVAVVRLNGLTPEKYVLSNVTTFSMNNFEYVRVFDGPVNVALSGSTIDLDRPDADFIIYAPAVTEVRYRGQRIDFVDNDGYISRDVATAVPDNRIDPARLDVRVYPNPFNPTTTIALHLPSSTRVSAVVYQPNGRRVKSLWDGPLSSGHHTLEWDGRGDHGQAAASGVYFVQIVAGNHVRTFKLTLLK